MTGVGKRLHPVCNLLVGVRNPLVGVRNLLVGVRNRVSGLHWRNAPVFTKNRRFTEEDRPLRPPDAQRL